MPVKKTKKSRQQIFKERFTGTETLFDINRKLIEEIKKENPNKKTISELVRKKAEKITKARGAGRPIGPTGFCRLLGELFRRSESEGWLDENDLKTLKRIGIEGIKSDTVKCDKLEAVTGRSQAKKEEQ